jgi:hypothetical protein
MLDTRSNVNRIWRICAITLRVDNDVFAEFASQYPELLVELTGCFVSVW